MDDRDTKVDDELWRDCEEQRDDRRDAENFAWWAAWLL